MMKRLVRIGAVICGYVIRFLKWLLIPSIPSEQCICSDSEFIFVTDPDGDQAYLEYKDEGEQY